MKRLFTTLLALVAVVGMTAHAGTSKDEILRKQQQHAAMLATQPAVNLLAITDGQFQPVRIATAANCDAGTPDIIIHDDGSAENGYGWTAAAGADARMADKFTPAAYPATINNVCMSFITNDGSNTLNFKVAVYADDGAGGSPGTLLVSKAFVANPVSLGGLPFTPTFESFDISDLALSIPAGSVYISANWDATTSGAVFIGADQSAATPLNGGYGYDSTAVWTPTVDDRPDYRALTIRAVMPIAGPGAPSLSKAFAPSQIMAGETSTLTIKLGNASQPTDPAVLTKDLVDTLPMGLVIATPGNAATTCSGGTLTAADGDNEIRLATGAEIPAADSCTITVDVTSAADGTYTNTMPAGALETDLGDNSSAATANLTVGYTFPEPYCPVSFPSAVEPISRVLFGGIDNPSSPVVGGSPALEDFTSVIGNVVPGQTLSMAVEGNTSGGFTTKIVVYIDWDQDGFFTGPDERYVIGDLFNSTGTDNKQAVADITVPGWAQGGNTRMRVMKRFSQEPDSCNTSGYGQAEDYTLIVTPSSEPTVSKSFAPAQVEANEPSTLTITLKNTENTGDATLSSPLVDNLPTGLVVADTPNASTTCAAGTVTANTGDDSVTLASGASIPGAGECTVTVDVQSATEDTYENTIPAGALQTDLGNNLFDGAATIKVGFDFPEPYCPINFPSAVEPITYVDFAGIQNPSDAAVGGSPALEDFTAIYGNVAQGDVLPMSVQGNTAGNYTAVITTYIDWDQSGTFEPNERYDIGDFKNSTGTDGKKATADIEVPAWAALGDTRMRVTKKFSSAADACNTAGYGQAEDYTVTVAVPVPKVSKTFAPDTVLVGESSTATITLSNPTENDATLTAPLVDSFPTGLTLSNVATSCGLVIGATAGTPSITAGNDVTLPAGIVLPAGSSCHITATVEAAVDGIYVNLIPAGALKTDQGDSDQDAEATLTVEPLPTDPIIGATPADLAASQLTNTMTTQTLTISNTGYSDLVWDIDEATALTAANPPSYKNSSAVGQSGAATLVSAGSLGHSQLGSPIVLAETDISQMLDNTPGNEGVSCGVADTSTADNSWWRRFYFDEHPLVGSNGQVQSVTISTGGNDVGALPTTINLYTIPHGIPVDTIPTSELTLIGTTTTTVSGALASVTIPVTGTVANTSTMDLVVEWHTDGNAAGGQFFPGANTTAETHPTFMSSDTCGIAEPTPAATIGSGFPDFHLTMIVTVGDSSCDISDLPWLSIAPTSGTTPVGDTSPVTVSFDSTGMATGTYNGKLCINSNDTATPILQIPVSMTVQGNPPAATVTPSSLSFSTDTDTPVSDTLDIANASGSDPLAFSIQARDSSNVQFELRPSDLAIKRAVEFNAAHPPSLSASNTGAAPSVQQAPWLPEATLDGQPLVFMHDDGSADNAVGWGDSDTDTESMAVWINRFAPPVGTGAYTITNVSIMWPTPDMSGAPLLGLEANLVVYYDFDADGDPSNAFRLGSDMLVSIDVQGEFVNYPVSINVPGDGDIYIGYANQWAISGEYQPRTYPGAIDEDASQGMSYLSGSDEGITDLDNLGNNETTDTIDALGLPGNWMIRAVGSTGTTCVGPTVPWIGVAPASGSVDGGDSTQVTVTADPTAAGLGAGTFTADLCITTNDPTQAMIVIPVTLEVTPGDGIFCDGFEEGGDGSCDLGAPRPDKGSDIVASGKVNIDLPATFDGIYVNWLTGATCVGDNSCHGQFNAYANHAGELSFLWARGNQASAGVSISGGTSFAVLKSGATIGPGATWSSRSGGDISNWRAGVDGFLGFAFQCPSASTIVPATCYGYAHIVTSKGQGNRLLEYSYDATGAAITIP